VQVQTETLATELFAGIEFKADFLKQKATRQLFAREQYLPSPVIDRRSLRGWQDEGRQDTFARARARVEALLVAHERPQMPPDQEQALTKMMGKLAQMAGMDKLPVWE
jgi:trimethylamine:corrinoid methyltransferase-like protein